MQLRSAQPAIISANAVEGFHCVQFKLISSNNRPIISIMSVDTRYYRTVNCQWKLGLLFENSHFEHQRTFHAFYSLKQPLNSVSFRPHTFSPHFQTRTSFCILPLALDQANDLYSKISIQKHDIKKKNKRKTAYGIYAYLPLLKRFRRNARANITRPTSTFADVEFLLNRSGSRFGSRSQCASALNWNQTTTMKL